MIEILAPVGGREQLLAAVRCGADAVYLGAKGFNARRNAENFEDASLGETVAFCHARNVRVHVTLNTLVMDSETDALDETIRSIAESGADAVIVQDLAVARRVREICPDIAMHASTQMAIHNAAGVRQAEELGFSRVVLARELSIPEIRAIHEKTHAELETFVHGALCMCVSGACELSAMLGGRSGNRGLCAQPCRLNFRAGAREYALSLKDLCAFDHIAEMRAAGVCSLKIEGRMKRPEYVAAAVTACRQAVNGEPYDLDALRDAFSRGGFTDGYLTGRRTLSMFGVRSKDDVDATARINARLAPLYRREMQRVPADMLLTLRKKEALLSVMDGENAVTVSGGAPQAALNAPTDEARARKSLEKTGDTPFLTREVTVDTDGAWMLPASALNAMRREALEKLLALRETPRAHRVVEADEAALAPHEAPETPETRLRFQSAGQLWPGAFEQAARVILPLDEISDETAAAHGDKLVAELPALIFPADEDAAKKRLLALKAAGLRAALCENLGAMRIAREAGLELHGGAALNLLSSRALERAGALGLADATVSFELAMSAIRKLAGKTPRGLIAYGRLPLMRMRCCPVQGERGCGACTGRSELVDRMGVKFPTLCDRKRYTTLLNSVPLNLSDEPIRGVDFITLYFTLETREECEQIARDFAAHSAPKGERTRGLYYRTLL